MNAALAQKVNKVLDMRLDQSDLLLAAKYLSSFYPEENSLAARRNLRGEIERRGVAINHQFLEVLENVQKQLETVENSVSEMRTCCDNMSERLKNTRDVAGKIISQAQKLQDESEHLKIKEDIANTFVSVFQLTTEEANAIYAPQIDEKFFASLKRIQQIHNDCKLLLRAQHRAGLEIMDSMAIHEQAAYNRLYHWIQAQCKSLDLDTPETNNVMKLAITALKERSALFNSCLEEIETTRCKAIVRGFLDALSKGGRGGLPRPIELHAHDPLRYVGDMLAWIHQAVASEEEFLSSLLGKQRHDEQLTKIFEGVCRPFKTRFDQVLDLHQSGNDVFVVYKLVNLVDFYYRTISKIMGETSSLSKTLYDSKNDALKKFYDLLKEQADQLQRAPPPPPSDLSPPAVLQETIVQLGEVMTTFSMSLVPIDQREAEFKPILIAVIDPLLQMCTLSATSLLNNSAEVAVYLINCLSLMQAALIPFDFTASRVERLAAQIDAHTDTLVDEEVTLLLANCGLAEKVKAIQEATPGQVLSKVPILDAKSLSDSVRLFESLLFEMAQFTLPKCEKIINARLRSTARDNVLRNLSLAYSTIYDAVVDPKNEYPDPTEIVRYKPDQIQTVLSIH